MKKEMYSKNRGGGGTEREREYRATVKLNRINFDLKRKMPSSENAHDGPTQGHWEQKCIQRYRTRAYNNV